MSSFKLASIEEAIEDFKKGQFVIVVDDEDRENEGDLIMQPNWLRPNMLIISCAMVVACSAPLSPSTAATNCN